MTASEDERRKQRGCLEDLGCAASGCLPWLVGAVLALAAVERRQRRR